MMTADAVWAPPNQVEEETGSAIEWLGNLNGVPPSLSILAEDGSEVVATLRFEGCGSRRRTSGVIRPETKTRGKGSSAARRGNPATGRHSMTVPRYWRPGHHGRSNAEAASRAEYGCHISASRFTRSLSVLWHASGRHWHPAEARGKSFF
jgi:hypothetical protein